MRRDALHRVAVLAIAVLLSELAGCQTIEGLFPGEKKAETAATQLLTQQQKNMRFADRYVGTMIELVQRAESAGDPEKRYALSGWALAEANAAYTYASGASPIVASLDLVTLATLSRMVVETNAPARFPNQAAAMIAAHREMESAAWGLVDKSLTPAQKSDLRQVLEDWRAQHPDSVTAPFVRFEEFAAAGPVADGKSKLVLPSSLMGFIGLDPMSGLDPAVRQVEQTRLLADRALYYAQRVPILFDLQLDRSANRIASGPESQRLQQQIESLSTSASRFATVAEALPGTLASEREALIRQLNDTLLAQAATLRPLLVDMRGTLEAGSAAAASVDQATRSIDALAARLAQKPGEPPGKPFDVNEYTQAATEIARAANQLEQLLAATGTQSPKLASLLDASASQGRALVDYFFVRVAWLIALLCAALLATLLAYRKLAPRVRSPS